jgi:uncharacterized membrane protein
VILLKQYEADLAAMTAARLAVGLMWVAIALKGAAVGKLKPGGPIGLCVYWTTSSRLAWDKGHRMLGRILFLGGLVGLATSLVLPPMASMAFLGALIATAVAFALIESWHAWRTDPDRMASGR